jgi:hypothetical protein
MIERNTRASPALCSHSGGCTLYIQSRNLCPLPSFPFNNRDGLGIFYHALISSIGMSFGIVDHFLLHALVLLLDVVGVVVDVGAGLDGATDDFGWVACNHCVGFDVLRFHVSIGPERMSAHKSIPS